MANGQHTLEVVAEDTAGYVATSSIQLNVIGQEPGALNIQDQNSWVACSATISNSTCAAGLGTATSSLTLHQSMPSLDGSASKFSIAGSHPYSNELYWIPLGGGNSVSRFIYDLWFYVDQGDAPQSLEFDVNQAFGGTRWTWVHNAISIKPISGTCGTLCTKCGSPSRYLAITFHRIHGSTLSGRSSVSETRCTT
jgi:hypothetical protein